MQGISKFHLVKLYLLPKPSSTFTFIRTLTLDVDGVDPPYADVPMPCRNKSERKPYPTPMKVLIRRAKQEKEARKAEPCRILEAAPENGLLVPELVEVAQRVYQARESLLRGLWKLVDVVPVKRCRFCSEVHIGEVGHEIRTCSGPKSGLRSATHVWREGGVRDVVYFPKCFHLYDRVGNPRVGHKERSKFPRIPAIVELCIQAGLYLPDYPTRRRTKTVYYIEGRIVDFDSETQLEDPLLEDCSSSEKEVEEEETCLSIEASADKVLESWFEMRCGVEKLMDKYRVWTCGYCPEVQVGPKGHKVRMCRASKHQSRNGLHAWQEATMDDFVGPNYVWHVKGRNNSKDMLVNELKRYYGKAPALVELCVQAGGRVPDEYKSMMRIDVVPPAPDEIDLVA